MVNHADSFELAKSAPLAHPEQNSRVKKPVPFAPSAGGLFPVEEFAFYKCHHNFYERAILELLRAERYFEYLTLVTMDTTCLNRLTKQQDETSHRDLSSLYDDLFHIVRDNVRGTDIVSGVENDLLGLLLVETDENGATFLIKRLKESLRLYLSNHIKLPADWQVPSAVYSFPNPQQGKEYFQKVLESFA